MTLSAGSVLAPPDAVNPPLMHFPVESGWPFAARTPFGSEAGSGADWLGAKMTSARAPNASHWLGIVPGAAASTFYPPPGVGSAPAPSMSTAAGNAPVTGKGRGFASSARVPAVPPPVTGPTGPLQATLSLEHNVLTFRAQSPPAENSRVLCGLCAASSVPSVAKQGLQLRYSAAALRDHMLDAHPTVAPLPLSSPDGQPTWRTLPEPSIQVGAEEVRGLLGKAVGTRPGTSKSDTGTKGAPRLEGTSSATAVPADLPLPKRPRITVHESVCPERPPRERQSSLILDNSADPNGHDPIGDDLLRLSYLLLPPAQRPMPSATRVASKQGSNKIPNEGVWHR